MDNTKPTKRDKLNLRMDMFPPNTITTVLVFTDHKADIAGWVISDEQDIEGMYNYIDITEREPE